MGRKNYKSNEMGVSDYITQFDYFMYRLSSIAVSCFSWEGLPDTIDPAFLERTLLEHSSILYFRDNILGDLVLNSANGGELNVYNIPTERKVIAPNGYTKDLTEKDSVLIWDNLLMTPTYPMIKMFSQKLANIETTMDINIRAQRTPIMIICDQTQRLTMENLFSKIQSGAPVIYGSKQLDLDNVKTLDLKAPYIVDKLREEKIAILHEAYSFLGVGSLEVEKRERLITNEVQASNENNIAQRASRLKARENAAKAINKMFGTDIRVQYNPEVERLAKDLEKESYYNEGEGSEE